MRALLALVTGLMAAGPMLGAGPAFATPAAHPGPHPGRRHAAATVKRSGTIVRVDRVRHALTIAEMGPWHGPGTPLTRHVVELAPVTTLKLEKPGPGGYVAAPLAVDGLHVGDYATVTGTPHGQALEATEVDVVPIGA